MFVEFGSQTVVVEVRCWMIFVKIGSREVCWAKGHGLSFSRA